MTKTNFFWASLSVTFAKNILIFFHDRQLWFMLFAVMLNTIFNICTCLNISRLHFDCSMICTIVSSYLSIYTFFETEVIYLQISVFKVLAKLLATTNFPSLCIEYISILLSCNHDFIASCKFHYFYIPIFRFI